MEMGVLNQVCEYRVAIGNNRLMAFLVLHYPLLQSLLSWPRCQQTSVLISTPLHSEHGRRIDRFPILILWDQS